MAEITSSPKNGKGKRLSTRVDLTPMVDLGFLLITFFIFTTTMGEAKALNIPLPHDGDSSQTPVSKTLNLILGDSNTCWHYNGDSISLIKPANYGNSGMRTVIEQKRKTIADKSGNAKDMVVLIKPTSESSYQNLVDVLDEMLIQNVTRYVIMEPSAGEISIIESQ